MPRPQVGIELALQGGGSHGAFTWGVLDRLLEEDRLEVAGSIAALIAVVALGSIFTRLRLVGADRWPHGLLASEAQALEKRTARLFAVAP